MNRKPPALRAAAITLFLLCLAAASPLLRAQSFTFNVTGPWQPIETIPSLPQPFPREPLTVGQPPAEPQPPRPYTSSAPMDYIVTGALALAFLGLCRLFVDSTMRKGGNVEIENHWGGLGGGFGGIRFSHALCYLVAALLAGSLLAGYTLVANHPALASSLVKHSADAPATAGNESKPARKPAKADAPPAESAVESTSE